MKLIAKYLTFLLWVAQTFSEPSDCSAQSTSPQASVLQGQVKDPSGAVVPKATVIVSSPHDKTRTVITTPSGNYMVGGLAAGMYSVNVTAKGFAPFVKSQISMPENVTRQLDVSLSIEVVPQQIQVDSDSPKVGTSPESNANALVIKGKEL